MLTVQQFQVRHGLSCVIGPVWPVGAGCYSQAALPMPLSKLLYLGKMMLLFSYAVTSRLRAQDSVTDVSNPFSRYRTQWGKSPRAVAGMEWEEIGLTLDT